MNALDQQMQIHWRKETAMRNRTAEATGSFFRLFFKFLFPALVCTVLAIVGPAVLDTIANASFVLLHVLLNLCRISLFVLHAFGI